MKIVDREFLLECGHKVIGKKLGKDWTRKCPKCNSIKRVHVMTFIPQKGYVTNYGVDSVILPMMFSSTIKHN